MVVVLDLGDRFDPGFGGATGEFGAQSGGAGGGLGKIVGQRVASGPPSDVRIADVFGGEGFELAPGIVFHLFGVACQVGLPLGRFLPEDTRQGAFAARPRSD